MKASTEQQQQQPKQQLQPQQQRQDDDEEDHFWDEILKYQYGDEDDNNESWHVHEDDAESSSPVVSSTTRVFADNSSFKQRRRRVQRDVFSPKDILNEIYWYIIDDTEDVTCADELCVQHVVNALHEEGIWFWRDLRFEECHKIAFYMAGVVYEQNATKHNKGQDNNNNNDITHEENITKINQLPLSEGRFLQFVRPCANLFLKAFVEEFVIPDWTTFVTDMTYHYHQVLHIEDGMNAQYIPILKDANPNKWAISFCSTDGQRYSIGDFKDTFSLQSVSKPITAAMCLSTDGIDYVEEWVGCEPSGRPFNSQDLMPQSNIPYNASMNTGAIMSAGIYASQFPKEDWFQVVERIRDTWYSMCGEDMEVGFSKETFDSEKETAYNNFAIAYNLKGRRGLPRDICLHKMLDVYLGCCSLTMCVEALAVAAATFANGGICPITSKEVFPAHIVRYVLSETMTCGMYDQSGHFAVQVGVPSKSGVSGVLMVIVPNVFGYATFSPRLNSNGNSVRGIEFSKRLVQSYRVHLFEPLRAGNTGAKVDPRTNGRKSNDTLVGRMSWALNVGDVWATRLRDIYLFAMVQASIASREGLTSRARHSIYNHYQMTYQQQLSDTLMNEVVDAVIQSSSAHHYSGKDHNGDDDDNASPLKQDSTNMKILEHLVKQTEVPDFMRTIIIQSLIDGALVDGYVDELEKDVIVKIATLLGMDRSVALMEIHRFERETYEKLPLSSSSSLITTPGKLLRRHFSTGSSSRSKGRRAGATSTTDPLTISDHMGMKGSPSSPLSIERKMPTDQGYTESGIAVGSPSRKEQIRSINDSITEQRNDFLQSIQLSKKIQQEEQKKKKKQNLKDATAATFGCQSDTCGKQPSSAAKNADDALRGDNDGASLPSSSSSSTTEILLRREVLRLRRKVDYLSHMLHDVQCNKRGELGTSGSKDNDREGDIIAGEHSRHSSSTSDHYNNLCSKSKDHCMLNVKRAVIQAHEEDDNDEK